MANTISGLGPVITTLPTQRTDDVGPVGNPLGDVGFDLTNSFDAQLLKAPTLSSVGQLSSTVTKTGNMAEPATLDDARKLSKLSVGTVAASLTWGVAGAIDALSHNKKISEDLAKSSNSKVKTVAAVASLVNPDGSVASKVDAASTIAGNAKELLGSKLTETATGKLGVLSKAGGAAAGLMYAVKNARDLGTNMGKVHEGDMGALFLAGNNLVQASSGTLWSAKSGADLIAKSPTATKIAEKIIEKVSTTAIGEKAIEAGLNYGLKAAKWIPIVGPVIGTGKAVYDMAKKPSWINLGKIGANALGFIPGVGTGVMIGATAALDVADAVIN